MLDVCGVLQRSVFNAGVCGVLQRFHEQRIVIRLAQSSQRILLLCKGQGLEPHIELERNLVEFGPILPHSAGDEQEVRIKNPCSFPLEVYSLEFDKTYLEEEKVRRRANILTDNVSTVFHARTIKRPSLTLVYM